MILDGHRMEICSEGDFFKSLIDVCAEATAANVAPIGMSKSLDYKPVLTHLDLVAPPVARALGSWKGQTDPSQLLVAEIDPAVADTAEFCERYAISPEDSANCVVIAGRRGESVRYAACVVLATTRADVNGLVRRRINARKASFAPMDDAVTLTQMQYGGITPIGLPADWPLLLDSRVVERDLACFGSGLRTSKLFGAGRALLDLPNSELVEGLAFL